MSFLRRLMIYSLCTFSLALFAEEPAFYGVGEADVRVLRRDFPDAFYGPLMLDEVDQLIRALTLTGLYERVTAESGDKGKITIIANALRSIKEVAIRGEKSFKESELRPLLGLEPGQRFERKKVIEAGERLKTFYGERGYFNAVIEVSFTKESAGELLITFVIIENSPCRIQKINIATENSALAERLSRTTQRYLKRPLTSEAVDELVQKVRDFLRDHRYLRAEIEGPDAIYNQDKTQANLTFHLRDPFRYEFIVDGNEKMSPTDVYRILSPNTLERGTSDPSTEAAERIRQGYLKIGFPNVEVDSRVIEIDDTFTRRVKLQVTENSQIRIKEIVINGRVSRPNSYYENFIVKNSSDLIRRGYYNRQDLERGFENLITELRNEGYLKAKVQSSRLEYLADRTEARVVVIMDEGPLTQVRSISFKGNQAFSSDELKKTLSVKSNSALRLAHLEKSLEEIKTFYHDQGYLEMRLLNESEDLVKYNDRGTHADITFDIYEGPKVTVQQIMVEGNSFTKSDVILRSIDIKKGDVLTPTKIDESEDRLNRLGIFSRATIKTMEDGTSVPNRTLIVSVSERDPGTFRLGAGVNSERKLTARGFMGLSYSNLFGTARGISGRAEVKSHVVEINYPQYEIVAGYLEPFLFNSNTRGRVNLTRSERIFEFDSDNSVTKITASNKVDLYAEHDFDKHLRLTWKVWSMDARREFERYGRCITEGVAFDPNAFCPDNVQQIATIGPIIDFDHRDNPFLPTRGHYTNFNLDYSHPALGSSSKINFFRTELAHTRYVRVGSGRKVWANSLRGGYEANLSDKEGSGIPTSHAFFLGGLSTIRGFDGTGDNEKLLPRYLLDVQRGNQLLIKSDSHYALFKSELRIPLFGEHGAVLFYDGGMVKVSGVHNERPYRDAIGIGYRYNTPVGPLSLDVGFKLNPNTDQGRKEKPYTFHFSFGTF